MKNPHREAYEEGGILGLRSPVKQIKHNCGSCNKLISKKDLFLSNENGKRWHYHCVATNNRTEYEIDKEVNPAT